MNSRKAFADNTPDLALCSENCLESNNAMLCRYAITINSILSILSVRGYRCIPLAQVSRQLAAPSSQVGNSDKDRRS